MKTLEIIVNAIEIIFCVSAIAYILYKWKK